MRYISRSSYEAFSACPRKGYNRYLLNGLGYQETLTPIAMAVGLLLHKGMEVLFLSKGDIEAAVIALMNEAELYRHLTSEDVHIARGSLLAWFRLKWIPFNEQYEVLMNEKEVEVLLSPLVTLQARADLVVKEKEGGSNWVYNWKTTSSMNNWNEKWRRDVQAWTEALAIEDALGERIEGCVFEGFYKGSKYLGKSTSPLVYGFFKGEGKEREFRPDNVKGWVKFPVWTGDFFPSQEEWILSIPLEILSEQFVRSKPIIKNDDVVRDWIEQVVREEEDRLHVMESSLEEKERERFFIQRFGEQCKWCCFDPACSKASDIPTLINDGFLVERVDHHVQQAS